MKTIKKLYVAFIVVMLSACGGDTISPVSVNVQGPLGKYYEVVS